MHIKKVGDSIPDINLQQISLTEALNMNVFIEKMEVDSSLYNKILNHIFDSDSFIKQNFTGPIDTNNRVVSTHKYRLWDCGNGPAMEHSYFLTSNRINIVNNRRIAFEGFLSYSEMDEEFSTRYLKTLAAIQLVLGCIRKYPQHIKTVHYSIDSKHYENISQLESQLRLIQDNLDKQVDNCAQSPYIDLYRTMSDNAQQNGKIYLSDGLWLDKDGNISD